MQIGFSSRRGVTLALSTVGIAAASIALAIPASASSLDTNAALGELNAARAKLGCASLSVSAELSAAAQDHSAYQAKVKNATPTGAGKSKPADRIAAAGYDASASTEIQLATDVGASSLDVAKALANSEKARTNVTDCTYTQVGFGLQAGPNNKSYWTIDLARPK